MYNRQRISLGLFHISFIVILLGAAITRHISFEGIMHIREGQTSDFILSSEDYLTIKNGDQTISATVLLSELSYKGFDEKLSINGRKYRIKSVGFIKNVTHNLIDNPANQKDAVVLEVSDGSSKQIIHVLGRHGQRGETVVAKIGNSSIELSYGAEPLYLPFALKLNDFQMEKYPGSDSPSSFASELTLIDRDRNVNRNVRIFMNNTLNYRGYKFFQSSYDQDEAGTVLSVNADMLGTGVTYTGYFLLALGMILSLFNKRSYFQLQIHRLKQYSKQTGIIIFALIAFNAGSAFASSSEIASVPKIDQATLDDFSKLWIQGPDGRIEPVSTLASEILRKVSRKSEYHGRSAEEVMLGLYLYPELWRNIPLVKLDNEQLKSELGVTESRIPLTAFFDQAGNYKLIDKAKAAFNKMPAFRNVYEKEIINVDERVNICFMIVNGELFSLFPGRSEETKWWASGSEPVGLDKSDSLFINHGFQMLRESLSQKSDINSQQLLAGIAAYQEKYATSYLPSGSKKKAEIFYNSLNPFKRVFLLYLLTGFTLIIVMFVNIFRNNSMGIKVRIAFTGLIGLGFLLHTFGLALRWYVSGHAPWSNGYESMVYVSWASMLAGFIFGRKYPMVIGTAAMLAGIILFVAHLNWMNPEITHLVPVLDSYWLMIHVAVITASYGFLGMSAFIGMLVLLLYCISNSENSTRIKGLVLQLTAISEMSVTVGLYLLTIGTFLGGIWANESWGRYWGWDAKETWALITVVIYSFIAHMRLMPGLKGIYNYTTASVLGFSSVLMTYFGVNYYLSGLHSYGRGSVDSVHWSAFIFIGLLAAIMIISNFKQKNLEFEN
jgi:cytochrome c-type biogenesis protein CcsB